MLQRAALSASYRAHIRSACARMQRTGQRTIAGASEAGASAASPAGPAHTNRLAGEQSPYLLQHQHNPVCRQGWRMHRPRTAHVAECNQSASPKRTCPLIACPVHWAVSRRSTGTRGDLRHWKRPSARTSKKGEQTSTLSSRLRTSAHTHTVPNCFSVSAGLSFCLWATHPATGTRIFPKRPYTVSPSFNYTT